MRRVASLGRSTRQPSFTTWPDGAEMSKVHPNTVPPLRVHGVWRRPALWGWKWKMKHI